MSDKCPLCGLESIEKSEAGSSKMSGIKCKRCGIYKISNTAINDSDIRGDIKKYSHILSGLAWEKTANDERLEITSHNIQSLVGASGVPRDGDISSKITKLLDYLISRTTYFGEGILLNSIFDYPIAFAHNREEFERIIISMIQDGILEKHTEIQDYLKRGLTGPTKNIWILSLALKTFTGISKGQFSKKVFIACHLDKARKEPIEAIIKGVENAGFLPICFFGVEGEDSDERIMDRAMNEIEQSQFVVIDTSGNRPSVAFEAGYALALGKRLIFVRDATDTAKREFYSGHYHISSYNGAEDLRALIQAKLLLRSKADKN